MQKDMQNGIDSSKRRSPYWVYNYFRRLKCCSFSYLSKLSCISPQIPKFLVNQVRKQNTENLKKDKKTVKKLLKKMAYDREKYDKQDRSTNDVRKPWSSVFAQISVLFLVSHTAKRSACVCCVAFYTVLGPSRTCKWDASVAVSTPAPGNAGPDCCSGVGDSRSELLIGNKGR